MMEPIMTAGMIQKYSDEKAILWPSILMYVAGLGPVAESFVRPNATKTCQTHRPILL
jgi:hypothetical protein